MMTTKAATFTTGTLEVQFGFLHKRDDKFGPPGNFNITVIVDSELQAQLDESAATLGKGKINGMYTKEGVTSLKVKTKFPEDEKSFPCVDSQGNETDVVAFGGDKVRLRIKPRLVNKDGSISFDLQGCQIIEKSDSEYSSGGGFGSVEGGYVAETETDDPVPF